MAPASRTKSGRTAEESRTNYTYDNFCVMKIKYIMYNVPSKRRCTPERTSCTCLTVSDVMAVNSAVLNVGPACLFERS
jgi:hypothetical protein